MSSPFEDFVCCPNQFNLMQEKSQAVLKGSNRIVKKPVISAFDNFIFLRTTYLNTLLLEYVRHIVLLAN